MILIHTLLGASTLFGVGYASAHCDLSDDLPAACDDTFRPGKTCTFYTTDRDPISGDLRYALLSFPQESSSGNVDDSSYPLILSFHGRTKDAAEQQLLTGLSDNDIGAIVAYPQSTCTRNRGSSGLARNHQWEGDPRTPKEIDDITFVSKLIDALTAKSYGIDSSRIYATGKSNGGGFLNLLACDSGLSKTIAAFAAASGAFYVDGTQGLILPTCSPSNSGRPIPFMEFHGTGDCTITYDGGPTDSGDYPGVTRPVFDVISGWGGQQGDDYKCTLTTDLPSTIPCSPAGDIEKFSWTCNNVADTVVHYKIPQLGHDWPGKTTNDDCKTAGWHAPKANTQCPKSYCPTCIDATSTILEWLQKFSIPPSAVPLDQVPVPEGEL